MKKILSLLAVLPLLIVPIIAHPQQPAETPAAPAAAPAAVPAARGSVTGTVTKSGTGQPLKSAQVSLQRVDAAARGNAANPLAALLGNGNGNGNGLAALAGAAGGAAALSAITDGKGQFTIANVPPGQYRIVADSEGYIRQEFGQKTSSGRGPAFAVAPGQALTADIQLISASRISGRVRDEYGESLSQATVQAYAYRYNNGTRTLAQVASAVTNDLGEYRLFWLQPGEYLVGVVRPASGGNGNAQPAALPGNNNNAGGFQNLIQQFTQGGSSSTFYFPGVTDPDQAAPFKVAASSDVPGVDFSLRVIPTFTLKGRVAAPFSLNRPNSAAGARGGQRGAPGAAAGGQNGGAFDIQALLGGQGVQVTLTRVGATQNGLAALGVGGLGGTQVGPDGSFEIRNVSSGSYTLSATARDPNNQQFTARTRLEVGGSDVTNLVLAVRAGIEVQGKILPDASQNTIDLTKLRVTLVAADDPTGGAINQLSDALAAVAPARGARGGAAPVAPAAGTPAPAAPRGAAAPGAPVATGTQATALTALLGNQASGGTVAADGSFTLTNVGASDYRIRVTGLPAGYYLQSGRIGTVDALNAPFSIAQPDTLQLQLGSGMGKVTGAVLDAKGSPSSGALAVLVPDPSRRGRTEVYFSANADQNGKFSFSNVPAGSYKLFSWEDIPSGAFQYPDYIRSYEDRGQAVTVEPNGTVESDVKIIESSIG